MTMITVEIPEQQAVSMVEQLSVSAKHEILKRLIADYDQWNAMVDAAEERMRALCAKRGLDWDLLDEEQRSQLIDTLLHCEKNSALLKPLPKFHSLAIHPQRD